MTLCDRGQETKEAIYTVATVVDYWMEVLELAGGNSDDAGRVVLHVECKHCGHQAALEQSALGKRDRAAASIGADGLGRQSH